MIFAPVRGAMALQQSHCDIDNEAMSEMMSSDVHMGHDMSMMASTDTTDNSFDMNHAACCCDQGCANNCDMSTSLSMIMQSSSYVPVLKNSSETSAISTDVLVRALSPPSRPPAVLYN